MEPVYKGKNPFLCSSILGRLNCITGLMIKNSAWPNSIFSGLR